jgi:hypothetical protein
VTIPVTIPVTRCRCPGSAPTSSTWVAATGRLRAQQEISGQQEKR